MEKDYTIKEIKKLWNEHLNERFPSSSRGLEVNGADLVLVDSYAVGCINTFLLNMGTLDKERKEYLIGCKEVLEKAMPLLTGESKEYFNRLLLISNMILSNLD